MPRPTSPLLLALCAAVACVVSVEAWLNEYDQPFSFQCPQNQFVRHLNSVHNNGKEDRVWDFSCKPLPAEAMTTTCAWTNYLNDFDQPETFRCPDDGYIGGLESYHNNHNEDRRFKVMCCSVSGAIPHRCQYTGYVNDFDGLMDYYVPDGQILVGMSSYHDNHREDRRFKFEICLMEGQ